ncbi:MAG: extracellular solute-binding protein [Mesorhizobium sp.]|nr:MAG: extracellular solute-binding protein [Mesorhizobium sp.]RWC61820.1 MAG: extracellular solute-binding protein [Mesorhizobium sp.]RWC66401.1 MAG: extracellular solute-binding protein [Mesorhizobium sp.]
MESTMAMKSDHESDATPLESAGSGEKSTAGSGLSRRKFLATTAAAAAAVSWSNLTIVNKAKAAGTLRVLAWPGYDEKPVVGQFEEENGVKVEFKNYIGGEQMMQFYAQSPKGTFDAIISDAEYVQKFVAQNAVVPLKKADFKHLADFHPAYQDFAPLRTGDAATTWGIGTRFSFYGISYNTKFVSDEEASSWSNLLMPKFKNKVVMFDWYLPNMSNASLAVFPNNQAPYDITADQLGKVKEWLTKLRPQIVSFAPQNQGLVTALLSEDAIVTPYGDMDIEMTVAGYDNFKSSVPKEGSIRWSEAACLCADSSNQELALKWIEYMSRPDIQAKLVYTKGFKARAPNMKVVDYWDDDQKKIMKYIPDPKAPGKLLVESYIELTAPRGLPVKQPEADWQAIFNAFKSA